MLSSIALLERKAGRRIPPQPRRAPLQRNLNLFDFLLKEIYVWETLENEPRALAIELLARLIARAAADNHAQEKTDIDFTYFVTAHELGHQWWAHQLIGANVQGSNMMSETLAEYSALMLMQKKYGPENMHRFLKHELDQYLRGRGDEARHEPPLALVQREPYVWYQKGGQIMYTLADYIGEDKVNTALRNFLMEHRYANATNAQTVPYPDTRLLVAALRAQTPPELQYLITDGFDNIVLYDNKVVSAVVTPTANHKFKVTMTVQASKVKADGNGNETPMGLNDYIEIGVFRGKKDEEQPLYLKKEKITQEQSTYEIVVNEMPTRAGIDPYNKLVDRNADDNMIDITKP
jgi:aminopeptidase N